jgi:hypothetical protein
MELTYWTMLKETKECVLDPYECTLDEYETYLEGDLSISGINTIGWNAGNSM